MTGMEFILELIGKIDPAINLQTPKRSNLVDHRDRNYVRVLIKTQSYTQRK